MVDKKGIPNRFSPDARIRGGPVDIDMVHAKLEKYCLRLKEALDITKESGEREQIVTQLTFASEIYTHLNKHGNLTHTKDFFNFETRKQDYSFISDKISSDVSESWIEFINTLKLRT